MKPKTTLIRLILTTTIPLLFPISAVCFYNPATGRWLSRDPIGEPGARIIGRLTSSQSGNLYTFVENNAVNYFDELGLKCCLKTWNWGNHPGEPSIYPHSALQCDDGTYISAFPTGGVMGGSPVQWSDETHDTKLYGTPNSTICSDCIDGSKVAAWKKSLSSPQYVAATSNCADYTAQAIAAGLPPEKQKKPTCSCFQFYIETLTDVMSYSGIATPSHTASSLKELIDNGCNRYKCKLVPPLWD
jgi:RHS repeat-associated protein